MRSIVAVVLVLLVVDPWSRASGQQPASPQPTFRSAVNLVLVDVVVRDRRGAIVKNLTADDFELLEDGVRQHIRPFAYEEVGAMTNRAADLSSPDTSVPDDAMPVVSAAASTPVPSHPLTSEDVAGHRLITLVFDTSSMELDDLERALEQASQWVDSKMDSADLVAVAAIASSLQVVTDFTGSKDRVRGALTALSASGNAAFDAVDASTASTDAAVQTATDDTTATDQSAQELDTFNNDVRFRALKTLAEALQPMRQKKAILYFSAGLQRSGTDNQVEFRAAVNAARRANAAIYPVDVRGLQAVVPGGSARRGSRGGLSAFSGNAVAGQFSQLADQQETLTALASDTGGTAFTDSNDVGDAFAKVARDISAYYILGFSSTNTNRDGRFRQITVRVKNHGNVRIEAKDGYYADRDFAHTTRSDREQQLEEELATPIPATDVPVFAAASWFRVADDQYFVPISIALAGSAVPASAGNATLDVAGFIRDERGARIGHIRDTVTMKATDEVLANRQILYETSLTLPPGRFTLKVVVRENSGGLTGTFETPIAVPQLKQSPVKVSSLVLSTQLRDLAGNKTANPLAKDGIELVPNVTHIVGHDQPVYFYYEVYDPAVEGGSPRLRTSLAFYRGKVRVLETPAVERTAIDAADRHAAVFQLELPAGTLDPGLYTCQVNIIDEVSGRFVFPRLQLFVR
jgi:VWFA-related protein